jgi:hypothetical protein
MTDRVVNIETVHTIVAESILCTNKAELSKWHEVPSAKLRDLTEVMHDPVLRSRGTLFERDHGKPGGCCRASGGNSRLA